jgi:hypothetical protein
MMFSTVVTVLVKPSQTSDNQLPIDLI